MPNIAVGRTEIAGPMGGYVAASGDVKALIDGAREGIAIWRSDLTPARVEALSEQLRRAELALSPAPPAGIKSWLGELAQIVSNPPGLEDRGKALRAVVEVCGDLPALVWTPNTRLAWARQPARNGYPVGSRWPAPGELYQHLLPYAEPIRREATWLRALIAKASIKPEPDRKKPTSEEKAAVAAMVRQMKNEREARAAVDEPRPGANVFRDVTLRGEARVAAYEQALEWMTPQMREVMAPQVAAMRDEAAVKESSGTAPSIEEFDGTGPTHEDLQAAAISVGRAQALEQEIPGLAGGLLQTAEKMARNYRENAADRRGNKT